MLRLSLQVKTIAACKYDLECVWFRQSCVQLGVSGCWLAKATSTSLEKQAMVTFIMGKALCLEAGLKCVLEGGMALCVMTPGTTKMPQWCADNLDSLLMVST